MAELTEQEMTDVMRDSILNVGHLLPTGMGLSFYRGADDPYTRIDVCWPDGTTTEMRICGCTPIRRVAAVHAIAAADEEG